MAKWSEIQCPRCEELEAKLRRSALQELSALGQASEAYQAQVAAEAKLAKAVEAERERIISMYRMLSTGGSAVGAGDGKTFAVQYVDPDKLAAAIREGGV